MTEAVINTFITLLVIINPFAVTSIFIDSTQNYDSSTKNRIINKAVLISTTLLVIFAFLGDFILDILGISEYAFRIAGGIILGIAGLDMVMAKPASIQSPTKDELPAKDNIMDIAVFPMSIPLMAGPGSLTTIVLMMREAQERDPYQQIYVIGSMLTVLVITWIIMKSSKWVLKAFRKSGINVITRVFGIILCGIAIQNILDGIRVFIN